MGFGPVLDFSSAKATSHQLPSQVALLGDSRPFLSHYVSGKNSFTKLFGLAHWLQAYSQGRITCPQSLNFGVAGDTTAQILFRLETAVAGIVAAKARMVFLVCGTNDISSGFTPGRTRQNIKRIIRRLHAEGLVVIVISESPRGGTTYALSAEGNQRLVELHRWYESEMPKLGVPVANVWDEMVDPATGYSPRPGVTNDELHQNPTGAEIYGRKMWRAAEPYFPMDGLLVEDDLVYHATNNVGGSLITNSLFKAKQGQIDASALATAGSVVPTGFSLSGETWAGLKVTSSLVSNDEYGNKLVLRITGTATQAGTLALAQAIDVSALAVSDKVRSTCLVETEGKGMATVLLDHLVISGSWNSQADGDPQDTANPYPSQKLGPISRQTPDLVFASDITGLQVRLQVRVYPGPVDANVAVSRLGTFKVA